MKAPGFLQREKYIYIFFLDSYPSVAARGNRIYNFILNISIYKSAMAHK
jgi:hypothetical protein